jgi:hypothetical protein
MFSPPFRLLHAWATPHFHVRYPPSPHARPSARSHRASGGPPSSAELRRKEVSKERPKLGAFVRLADPGVCCKTADVAQYVAHVALTAELRPEIFAETLKPRWANDKFRAWQAGQRVLANFWSGVRAGKLEDGTAGVHPVIAFGDAQFAASGRGRHSAPTSACYVACVNVMGRSAVCLTTEHRSTRCHHACGHLLQQTDSLPPSRAETRALDKQAERQDEYAAKVEAWKVQCATADERKSPRPPRPRPPQTWKLGIRGLLRCTNPECPERHRSLIDRDENAALNILRAFQHRDRGLLPPEHMCRPAGEEATKKRATSDELDAERNGPVPFLIVDGPRARATGAHGIPHGDGLGTRLRREMYGSRGGGRGGAGGGAGTALRRGGEGRINRGGGWTGPLHRPQDKRSMW